MLWGSAGCWPLGKATELLALAAPSPYGLRLLGRANAPFVWNPKEV